MRYEITLKILCSIFFYVHGLFKSELIQVKGTKIGRGRPKIILIEVVKKDVSTLLKNASCIMILLKIFLIS